MRTRAVVTLVLVMAVAAAACSRDSSSDSASDTSGPAASTTAPTEGLDAGAFGDLGEICSPGDAKPVTGQTGIDGTTIHVATFSDKGFAARPGTSRELHDTAEAVTKWCNEHGGVRGYKIDPHLRDAAVTNYQPLVAKSCDEDFFMVGGGAALDSTGVGEQIKCGLPNIPAYVVNAEANGADLTVSPVPFPTRSSSNGDFAWLKSRYPGSITKVGMLTASYPPTDLAGQRQRETAEALGFEIVDEQKYSVLGESNWTPFVQALKEKGVEGVIFTGDADIFPPIVKAMNEQEFEPKWILGDVNLYDKKIPEVGGAALDVNPVYARDYIYPFEKAEAGSPSQQYLDLLEQYGPEDSRVAFLGVQSMSAYLLFFKALGECADAGTVTRDCVYEKAATAADWTGGGLHVPTDPGGTTYPECFGLVQATSDGFTFPDITEFGSDTASDFFACDPTFVAELTGDYPAGEKCPSGIENPLPSECAA